GVLQPLPMRLEISLRESGLPISRWSQYANAGALAGQGPVKLTKLILSVDKPCKRWAGRGIQAVCPGIGWSHKRRKPGLKVPPKLLCQTLHVRIRLGDNFGLNQPSDSRYPRIQLYLVATLKCARETR